MISSNLENKIFSLVASITGHNINQLELDMYLESELGLDSIKMLEFFNGIMQIIPKEQRVTFSQKFPVKILMQIQTLREAVVILQDWQSIDKIDSLEQLQNLVPAGESDTWNSEEEQKSQTVDILDSQYLHLMSHWLVGSNSLGYTLRWEGDFNVNLARQSWQELITRHPILRSHFSIPTDANSFKDYQLVVLDNPHTPIIPVTDISHLSPDAQEKLLNDEFAKCLNIEWQLTNWPLHKFFVFRLADSVYQLFLANEHLISDGLGSQLILREFMEIYRAKAAGEQPKLPPVTTVNHYQDIVAKLNSWSSKEEEKLLVQYISHQGKSSYFWNPQQTKINAEQRPKYQNLRYCLDQDTTAKLIAKTSDWRVSVNSLLVAAFLKALAKLDQSSESFILQVPTSGRLYPGVDASNVVSSFAQNLALTFSRPQPQEDWQALVNRIHQEIQTALANGYDRVQSQQMARVFQNAIALENGKLPEHSISMFRSGAKSNLYVPYTGQTHIQTHYGAIKITDYRAGGNNAIGTIDLLQEIFSDRLHLFASYDSNFFHESIIDSLLQEYTTQIQELITATNTVKQPKPSILPLQTDNGMESILQQIAEEICHCPITTAQMEQDIEADLGMDSLEFVRIITRLEQRLGKVNRQALLACRTLREMAITLSPVSDKQPLEIPYLQIIEQARHTPEAIAVFDGESQLTYKQLNLLSNQIANYLRSQGIGANSLVGVMMRRSPLMLVAILGILKAGGAYVPLDPSYPGERVQYMLAHAEINIVLTEHRLTAKLAECLTEQLPLQTIVFLDEGGIWQDGKAWQQICQEVWSNCSQLQPSCINKPDDLMTVLFTSGSTGRPKGVMLNHQGYMNRLQWMQKAFQLKPGDRVAQKTSCCFDISVWELFWPLMEGATVCPVETEIVKNPWRFAQWLQETRINIAHFVPSLFGEFIAALESEAASFPELRWLIFSGEALPVPFIQRWIDNYGMSVGLANLYGPTEASIDVTAYIIEQRPGEQESSIPIGKAIDNVYIMLLNEQMQPVTPGELGQLWIGGVQLAKGYLKDAERTADVFRANPFAHIPGEYIYRTGDLAKELPDGNIEYHGRIDHQVKIRGFRVELGEIESVLMSHPAVNEAGVVVVDYGDGDKRLVAGLSGSPVDNKQIKEHLQQRLPHYMIPHRLKWLPNLPKNHNGKLDRKALLAVVNEEKSVSETKTTNVAEELLPLAPAQRWLIDYFAPTHQWAGYSRFLYRQALDLDAFNQALNLIVERHDALRTVFVERDGQYWQQLIKPDKQLSAEVYDGSHLSMAERDHEIQQLIQQQTQQLQIAQWPLLKVLIVKVDESSYDITFVAHHIIGDLLSSNIIFHDFWLFYGQVLGNETTENQPSHSYADFVRLLVQAEQQGNLASHLDYWQSKFPSQEYSFQIPLDDEKGANVEASSQSEKFTLSKTDSKTLLRQAKKHYDCNLYTILLAPLYELMAEWSEQSWVVLSHRSHGRDLGNNQRFMETVGNFAVNFPLGIKVNKGSQWQQTIKQIEAEFEQLPMNGVTYDWLSGQMPNYMYPDANLTPIRANYLGNRNAPTWKLFEFQEADRDRRLSPPDQKRTTLLEFFFSVVDGCLELEIEYSSNFHRSATISKLGERYLELIQDLLEAMSEPEKPSISNGHSPRLRKDPHILRYVPLLGKVALVIGGDSSVGQAIALKLAEQGASVVVVGQNATLLTQTVTQIQQIGADAIAIPANVSDLYHVHIMLKDTISKFGGIDILVNNATVVDSLTLNSSEPLQWQRVFEQNLFTTYNCCHSVIPYLNQRGKGKIVNIGFDPALTGSPLLSGYAACGQAISGLTKSLAEELKHQNIQVNAVHSVMNNSNPSELGKFMPVKQVVDVVSFLVAAQSDGITGECLKVFTQPETHQPPSSQAGVYAISGLENGSVKTII
ncbi:non-ribosomal peptide synthetase [Nostoc sp. FACHB-110]|uniref:non-ribosomal peptide synthetase n=1 Tax=Nostoc sp. FACHB-110 TaxID=2692834 RepID=UPI00168399F2|nr:non-ribosomal peptide synthetase [Nostoc sp. FACHB-110]MBD2439008.1 amino acid adenylation domain-containing protein [Nostoc sp. FACHB-110]